MEHAQKNEYYPDCVSPPGDSLIEVLLSMGMSQVELSERTGRTKKHINEIIKGKAPITPETAIQLEKALSIPASFWNNYEKNYRDYLARQAEMAQLNDQIEWLKKFPIKRIVEYGWLPKTKDQVLLLRELLRLLGIASPENWDKIWGEEQFAFRVSLPDKIDRYALSAWLAAGKSSSKTIECQPYDRDKFIEALNSIRDLTRKPVRASAPKIIELCADAGVAVVYIKELPKCGVYGASHWINKQKAIILLNLFRKWSDQFWFSFFHEAAHILLHRRKEYHVEFKIDDSDMKKEADEFASNILIPKDEYQSYIDNNHITAVTIRQFAKRIDIHPGIVVGRLQHDQIIPFRYYVDLKQRLTWV